MAVTVVNYYEALNLDRELSTVEINTELSKLETVWKRREITNPEKAAKMNALIIDARKVFKTDATRRVYDVSLNPPQSAPVPMEPRNKVEQWQIDAINKAEMERRHLEEQENQKFQTRTRRIEERKAATTALFKKAWITFAICVAIAVLAFITFRFARIPVFLLVIVVFGGMGFLNYCDMYRNGIGSGLVKMGSILGGFVFCFMCATARYTQMGYSAASASATWKTMGILLVIMMAIIVITRKVGKSRADSAYRQNLF